MNFAHGWIEEVLSCHDRSAGTRAGITLDSTRIIEATREERDRSNCRKEARSRYCNGRAIMRPWFVRDSHLRKQEAKMSESCRRKYAHEG